MGIMPSLTVKNTNVLGQSHGTTRLFLRYAKENLQELLKTHGISATAPIFEPYLAN